MSTTPVSETSVTIAPSNFTPLDLSARKPSGSRKPGRHVLLICLVLFTLAMWFLHSTRSLQIIVEAESPADVSVTGLALPFGKRYLLRPGTYEINVSAVGYEPLVTTVIVDERDNQAVNLSLQALPGLVSLDSTPQGASVVVDGNAVGKTPLRDLKLPAGEHRLLLEEARHLPLDQLLQVTGRNVRQQLQLQLSPAWAHVKVDSVPAGASILVDGEAAGQTPASAEVLQGERQLTLRLPGYADWQQTLNIKAGADQDLGQVKLLPAPGALELGSVPSGAAVTLDGDFQGQTPLTLDISPGRVHRLDVFKSGYQRYSDKVELAAATRAQRTVTLKAQLGEVRFKISPANAIVRINGKTVGKGNLTLTLPAVEHAVEISLDGYASVRRNVTPRPGLPQQLEVALQTSQQAARQASPLAAQAGGASRLNPQIITAAGQTMLLLKPGESAMADFTMGASRREPGRRANEVLHPVSLRRMFYLQTTEVTNAQYRLFQSSHNSGQVNGNDLNGDLQPVVKVSWQDAAAFCNWLSAKEGLPEFYQQRNGRITGYNASSTGYRLPSEAEWDWAARVSGETMLTFPWGETFPPTLAVENYADNTSAYVTGRILNNYKDGHVVSAPVGSFKANQHGIFDMGGNVAEWVHDVYTIPNANAPAQKDPLGGQGGDNYVIRGASWTQAKLSELRLAFRDYGKDARDDVGFRIARYAE
jgi:formylglycine-generating enzyme required for sulfatase activity